MPASNQRALQKARTLAADCLIFDLEDAVAPAAKAAARTSLLAALDEGGYGNRELVIRTNGLETPWGAADIDAAARSGAHAVLVPKVSEPADIERAAQQLARAGAPDNLALWAMAETPAAVLQIDAIASAHPALAVIVMGTNDLAKALRLPADPGRTGLLASLGRCQLAARARGLDILDGVFGDLADESAFRVECFQGKVLGFDGKTLIHPSQIALANEIFGVTPDEVRRAEAVVSAWEAAAAEGRGIAVLDGQMIEHLHAEAARRTLALAAATSVVE